jgi:acyl carrier protein
MTPDEARHHVVKAIHDVTNALHKQRFADFVRGRATDLALADLGLDSLEALEVCRILEEQTGIEVDLGDLLDSTSVNSLAALLVSRAGNRRGGGIGRA